MGVWVDNWVVEETTVSVLVISEWEFGVASGPEVLPWSPFITLLIWVQSAFSVFKGHDAKASANKHRNLIEQLSYKLELNNVSYLRISKIE